MSSLVWNFLICHMSDSPVSPPYNILRIISLLPVGSKEHLAGERQSSVTGAGRGGVDAGSVGGDCRDFGSIGGEVERIVDVGDCHSRHRKS